MTQRYALIGDPVAQSLSPHMHAAAYAALGLDATYEARRVLRGSVGAALTQLWDEEFVGFNITVPHKVEVMPHLSAIDEAARAIGAVNTVARGGDGWHGTNTDAEGFVRSLPKAAATYATGLVLGAGGAARAVVHGLRSHGVKVVVSARRPAAAESLSDLGATTVPWPPVVEASIVVNATSASWREGKAFADSLSWSDNTSALFVDLAYGKRIPFLEQAAHRGHQTLDGLGMLVHQGALAFERWTGQPAPIDVMNNALRQRLASAPTNEF